VAEAAVVAKTDPQLGQAITAFVTLKGGQEGNDEVAAELRAHVAKVIGKLARPQHVIFTEDLPKTRSGKIMRRLLRDVAEGRQLGDVTTLANAEIVDRIREMSSTGEEE
jgi:acetyl-CoA synthetase